MIGVIRFPNVMPNVSIVLNDKGPADVGPLILSTQISLSSDHTRIEGIIPVHN